MFKVLGLSYLRQIRKKDRSRRSSFKQTQFERCVRGELTTLILSGKNLGAPLISLL